MEKVETITDYLKRRLREAGPSRFDAIAASAGVTVSFIRKFVYGSRENPRVQTIQPLLDYFAKVDRGEIHAAEAPRSPHSHPGERATDKQPARHRAGPS